MGAGLIVYGDHGKLQIDDTYPNLQLLYQTTVTTASVIGGGMFSGSLTGVLNYGGGANPVIAVRCSSSACVYWCDDLSGKFQIAVQDAVGTPVTVYVFAEPSATSANYGLQVFDAAGKLRFDAAQKAMRVSGSLVTTSLGATLTMPAGRTYAAVIGGGLYANVVAHTGGWTYYMLRFGAAVSSNVVTVGGVCLQYTPNGTGTAPGTLSPGNVLCVGVDVTNY